MTNPKLRAALFALPLIGLVLTWATTHHHTTQGTEWDVPVTGYDPADPLRGHYIQFTYAWPGQPTTNQQTASLCLEGQPPILANTKSAQSCQTPGSRLNTSPTPGRLYIPQTSATQMQSRLNDPQHWQAYVRIRVHADGSFSPISISFKPQANPPKN